jgi:hypothetical protein
MPSALFEAVWVRSHIPLMAPWVRPDPPSMKPWVKLDVSFILAIRTISKIMSVTRYWMYDSLITVWIRRGNEYIALWIRSYAPFMTNKLDHALNLWHDMCVHFK